MEYEQIIQCDKFTSSKMACSDICRKKRTTRKLLRLGISIHHIEVKIIQIQTTGYRKEEEKNICHQLGNEEMYLYFMTKIYAFQKGSQSNFR